MYKYIWAVRVHCMCILHQKFDMHEGVLLRLQCIIFKSEFNSVFRISHAQALYIKYMKM